MHTATRRNTIAGTQCAPSRERGGVSCFTTPELHAIADAYNATATTTRIKYHATTPKATLWRAIDDRMQHETTCATERCWVTSPAVRGSTANNVQRVGGGTSPTTNVAHLARTAFRPEMPASWRAKPTEWLSTTDIQVVMKQYEAAHKGFKFIGAVPVDFASPSDSGEMGRCVVQALCNVRVKRWWTQGIRQLGIVYNMDAHDEPGSHWTSSLIDLQRNALYYYDSFGAAPPPEVHTFFRKLSAQLEAFHGVAPTVEHNTVRHQFNNTECGIYSLFFLASMLEGTSFASFVANGLNDAQMNRHRRVFYSRLSDYERGGGGGVAVAAGGRGGLAGCGGGSRKRQRVRSKKRRTRRSASLPKGLSNPPANVRLQFPKHYITHFNGARCIYVTQLGSTLQCYKIVYPYDKENNDIPAHMLHQFDDYTSDEKTAEKLYIYKTPQFVIHNCKNIFVGHDTNPDNTYIKNRLFGYGNTLLVVDKSNHIFYIQYKVLQLHKIKGKIIGYISPIGNNDCPYPIMFTTTHLYEWCDTIKEHLLPHDNDSKCAIQSLKRMKHAHARLNAVQKKQIHVFITKYQCSDGKEVNTKELYNIETPVDGGGVAVGGMGGLAGGGSRKRRRVTKATHKVHSSSRFLFA